MDIESSPHLVNKHIEAEARNTLSQIKTSRYRHGESYISQLH